MNNDLILILKAASFAAEKHRGQLRKDAESTAYINHPLNVARILAEEGGVSDAEILAGALLHDTIEDTETSEEELALHFGERIASIVAEVTDDKTIKDKDERKRLQVVNAPHKSAGAAMVKLADKISNVRDVGERPAVGWSVARRVEYLDWAKRVVDELPVQDHVLNETFMRAVENSRRMINKPTQFTTIRRATAEDYRKAAGYTVGTFHRAKAPDFKEPLGTQPPQRAALDLENLPFDPAEAAGEYSESVVRSTPMILAERESSGMTSTWDEFLCLALCDDQTVLLFTGRREALADASDFYDENEDEYDIPDEIDGKAVWGVKDGCVLGENIENYDEDALSLKSFDSDAVLGWLEKTDWQEDVSQAEVKKAFNKLRKLP